MSSPATLRQYAGRAAAALLFAGVVPVAALAQDVRLTDGMATTVRGGSYAATNYASNLLLETRASGDATYTRRILLKFDTQNTIPAGAAIASAKLTMTVAGGNSEARTLTAYRIAASYEETQATWNKRNSSYAWTTCGGDLAEVAGTQTVTSTVGSVVTFDVTALVQATVNGKYSSRYTRIAIVDGGASSQSSYKQYYSDEAADATVRPTLTVTLASASAPVPEVAPSSSSTTLRVLQWNTHHGGYGTDGVYDPNRLANWIVKINPDIISLNEIEYYTGYGYEDQPARYASLLKQKTGVTWYYKFVTASGASKGNGNLILSRLPLDVKSSLQLSYSRAVAQVTLTVNGRTINFLSTHLDDDSTSQRLTEIGELQAWAGGLAEQRIIAGDFNAWPGTTEISKMTGLYYDSWAEAVKAGTAIAYAGNTAGNTRNSRIDYIFYSHTASALALKSSQVFDTRDANGVMPSDHRPLLSIFTVK